VAPKQSAWAKGANFATVAAGGGTKPAPPKATATVVAGAAKVLDSVPPPAAAPRPPPQLGASVSHYTVFIKGLPPGTTEKEVIEAFSKIVPLKTGMKIDWKTVSELDRATGQTVEKTRTFAFANIDCPPSDNEKSIEAMKRARVKIQNCSLFCDLVKEKAVFAQPGTAPSNIKK